MAENREENVENVKSDENLASYTFGDLSNGIMEQRSENFGLSNSDGLVLFSNVCESYQADVDIICNCIIVSKTLQLQPEDKIGLYETGSKKPNDFVADQCIEDMIENEMGNEGAPIDYASIRQFKVTFKACNLPMIFEDTYYQLRYISGSVERGASTKFCIRGQSKENLFKINKTLYDENKLLKNLSKEKTETDKNIKILEDEVNGLRKLKENCVCEKWWKKRFNYISIGSFAFISLIVATLPILLKVNANDKEDLVMELKKSQSVISNYKDELENLVKKLNKAQEIEAEDKQQIGNLLNELNEVKDIGANDKEEFVKLKNELKQAQSVVSNYKDELENLVKKLNKVQEIEAVDKQQLVNLVQDKENLIRELKGAQSVISNYKDELEKLRKKLSKAQEIEAVDKQQIVNLLNELNGVKDIGAKDKEELVKLENELKQVKMDLRIAEERVEDQNALLNTHFSEHITSKGQNTLEINLGFAYLNLVGFMAIIAFVLAVGACWYCGIFTIIQHDRRQRIYDRKVYGIGN
jgi:ABC-type transporter Mla subunit MlaD